MKTNLKVLGHASDDMKMDSVMSSRTWSKNSALAQASVADSILLGFNSQDWRDSIILEKGKVVLSVKIAIKISKCQIQILTYEL